MIDATVVFERNWEAIHRICDTCSGTGLVNGISCSFCGTGEGKNKGSGRYYKYIINEGSSGSSKTSSLILLTYLIGFEQKGKRMSVWRDTKKDCRDTVMYDMLHRYYPNYPHYNLVHIVGSQGFFTFPSKSTMEICGTDDENKVHGWNGHITWFNEPYDIPRETFDQLDMRTEDFVLIDWNPKMAHWVDDLKKTDRAIVIKSTFKDNPFCPPERKTKILSYQPVKYASCVRDGILTEGEAQQYNLTENKKGLSDQQLNELARCKENERTKSANQFNWQVYGLGEKAEKPNRILNFEEISDEDYHKINAKVYYASDWGTVDPWAILEAKYYDGGLYLHERNYRSENEIRANLLPQEIEQIEKLDEGLVRWVFDRLNISKKSIIVCDDNREMKVIALRQAGYDYAIKATKGQDSVREGISLLQSIRVYFTSSSKNLQYEQENYEWQTDRYGYVTETPVDRDNHLIDCARYIANFLKINGIIKTI